MKTGNVSIAPDDIGQPGCTNGERNRLAKILESTMMIDAYRHIVGEKTSDEFTWRGIETGKHGERGMRIDHCMVSKTLLPVIQDVRVLGERRERKGFMGSDHCPVLVVMRDEGERLVEEMGQAEHNNISNDTETFASGVGDNDNDDGKKCGNNGPCESAKF